MIQFIYKIAILNGEHDHRPSDFWGLCTQLHGVSFDTSASMSRAHIPKKKVEYQEPLGARAITFEAGTKIISAPTSAAFPRKTGVGK
jgi:hypothetical protein